MEPGSRQIVARAVEVAVLFSPLDAVFTRRTPALALAEAGGSDVDRPAAERLLKRLGRNAQLSSGDDSREQVIQVGDGIGADMIGMLGRDAIDLVAELAHRELVRLLIDARDQIVRRGVFESAGHAMRATKMAEMAPVVLEGATAFGAGGQVAHDTLRAFEVVGKMPD